MGNILGTRKRKIMAGIAGCLVLMLVLLLAVWNDRSLPDLDELGIVLPEPVYMPVHAGADWRGQGEPAADGYVRMLENGRYALYVDPATSKISVEDQQNGYRWYSNPSREQLEQETIKGILRSNLESTYVLEYFEQNRTQRFQTNRLEKNTTFVIVPYEGGVQINYNVQDLAIRFAIQYELTAAGLRVNVPDQGIVEEGTFHVISLQVLPMFGAVRGQDEEGYLFVPDGPGGLIRFDSNAVRIGSGYNYPVFGHELTNAKDQLTWSKREAIAYPVFGLKRQDAAFLAVVGEGAFASTIRAVPAGISSIFNTAGAQIVYREEYGQRLSRLRQPVNTIQQERSRQDWSMEYRLLRSDQASYVGMAHSYREYLEENGQLSAKLPAVEHIPLHLTIMGGEAKDSLTGPRYIPMTTFEQATAIVEDLVASGVKRAVLSYRSWQSGGTEGESLDGSIERKLGGRQAAARFIAAMHELSFPVLFEHNLVYLRENKSGLAAKSTGVRSIDGTVYFDPDRHFALNPVYTLGFAAETIDELTWIGVDGIHYDRIGELVFRDHNSNAAYTRSDTAYLYRQLLAMTRDKLGMAAVNRGQSYTLGESDFVFGLPFDPSYDFIVDETVPFYPIALHGAVAYTAKPANSRDVPEMEMLRAIEYGAIPSFIVTHESTLALRGTETGLYSTKYSVWRDTIVEEYRQFNELAAVYDQRIVDHERLSPMLYRTSYEDGTQVEVDYASLTFRVIRGGGEFDVSKQS